MDKKTLWDRYIEGEPGGLSYGRFSARLKKYAEETSPSLSYPKERKPGQAMETDWCGERISVLYNPATKQYIQTSIFVASIGFSGRIFAFATLDETQTNWIQAHTKALEFYQAIPRFVIPDNASTAVNKANRYEPTKHPVFLRWAMHYNIAIQPARVRRPKDKDRVEAAVNRIEHKILPKIKEQIYFDLHDLNRALLKEVQKINNESYQKRPGSRNEIFQTIDLPAMRHLPAHPFTLTSTQWVTASKSRYHIYFDGHEYSVPYHLAGQKVLLVATDMTVELLYKNKRVAFHQRSYDNASIYVTDPTHMPKNHRYQREIDQRTDAAYLEEAGQIGPATKEVIQSILAAQTIPEEAHPICLGIVRLADRYSPEALEQACCQANELALYSYLEIASLLKQQTEVEEIPLRNRHSNLRGANYYN